MPILLMICLAWPGSLVHATIAPTSEAPPSWTCSLQAELFGSGIFYLRYGRDAWNGSGHLNCLSRDGVASDRMLAITYASSVPGVGVNETSWVSAVMEITITVPPEKFEVYSAVTNNQPPPQVSWQAEGTNFELHATLLTKDRVEASLQQGELILHAP